VIDVNVSVVMMRLLMQRAGLLQVDRCECVSCNDAVADAESRTTTR